jgi:hypothetical protein
MATSLHLTGEDYHGSNWLFRDTWLRCEGGVCGMGRWKDALSVWGAAQRFECELSAHIYQPADGAMGWIHHPHHDIVMMRSPCLFVLLLVFVDRCVVLPAGGMQCLVCRSTTFIGLCIVTDASYKV